MTCCAPAIEASAESISAPETNDDILLGASLDLGEGHYQLELALPDIHCAACINTIEKALAQLPMVNTARVNFSNKRVRVDYVPAKGHPSEITSAIHARGYRAFLLDPESDNQTDTTLRDLVRALAVAGFAAANIMLFSVSIWSGAEPVTRDLFHWISALIAVPAVAYAGRPFFTSAWRALRHGALNMDVPISLAVLLALALSLFETYNHGQHAYFDASVTLLFFLLIGRTLDHMMREKARSAVRNLARLAPPHANRRHEDGRHEKIALKEILPGMLLDIAPGDRLPVDAEIVSGNSDVDRSLVNGEPVPEHAGPGSALLAGTTNLSGPLLVRATQPAADSFLARMIGLMEAAEGSKAGYKNIADRAAAIYAPTVHVLALGTLLFWGLTTGNWHMAILYAIAVLIITCPCALALAVPIVHIVASGRLFEQNVMMRDGAALERLAQVNRIAFDKTGTLTAGKPRLNGQFFGAPTFLARAASLAAISRHPFSTAIHAAAPTSQPVQNAREIPGAGIEATDDKGTWRLGNAGFCNAASLDAPDHASTVWLSLDGVPKAGFSFTDPIRPEAATTIAALHQLGLQTSLLSGDRADPVAYTANAIGITDAHANLTPEQKLKALQAFSDQGEKTVMVGDGINDAPALRAAYTSMAPSSAADIGRNAADFVYTNDNLGAVLFTITIARRAAAMVRQNFGLAILYNCIAIPLAVTGHVTPLVAAIAMSSSSIIVTLNALRLRWGDTPEKAKSPKAANARISVPA